MGSDWQSLSILVLLPEELKRQDISAASALEAGAQLIPKDVISAISDIPNIKNVYPFRALPCLVTTEASGTFPAILRGFNGQPLSHSLEPYLHKEENTTLRGFFLNQASDMECNNISSGDGKNSTWASNNTRGNS